MIFEVSTSSFSSEDDEIRELEAQKPTLQVSGPSSNKDSNVKNTKPTVDIGISSASTSSLSCDDDNLVDEVQVLDKSSPQQMFPSSQDSMDSPVKNVRKKSSQPRVPVRRIALVFQESDEVLAKEMLQEDLLFDAPFAVKSNPDAFDEYRENQLEMLKNKETEVEENKKNLMPKKAKRASTPKKKTVKSDKSKNVGKPKRIRRPRKWWKSIRVEEDWTSTSGSEKMDSSSEDDQCTSKKNSRTQQNSINAEDKSSQSQEIESKSDDDLELSKSAQRRIRSARRKLAQSGKGIATPPMPNHDSSLMESDEEQDIICIPGDVDRIEQIKVKCQGEILKFPMKMNDTFCEIFQKIAKKYNINASEVLLCTKNKTICVEDTPKELKISTADILDCCFWSRNSVEESSKNIVKMKFQSSDPKNRTTISVHKLEPLLEMMRKYSKEKCIPLEKLVFEFDGEKIEPDQTAVDLDMEDEGCIDVKIII